MMLSISANKLFEEIKSTVNLAFKQECDSLERLTHISADDLEGYASLYETLTALGDYLEEDAKAKDEMTDKLDNLLFQIKAMNSKMEQFLEKKEES